MCIALRAGEVDHVLVQRRLVLVEEAHELADAALVAEDVLLLFALALVFDGDRQAAVEESLLAHARVQDLVVVDRVVEDLAVGLEGDVGAVILRRADDLHLLGDRAAGELHLVDPAVAVHLHLQPLAQRVDDRGADAVQAAGDLVAAAAELAAGVQHRVHDLQRGTARLRLDIHGDAAAVVGDGDRPVGVDRHADMRAEAGQRLVDGVVHDLVNEVMQAGRGGGADIHARALPDGLQAFEHLDLRGVIACFRLDDLFDIFRFFRQFCHISLREKSFLIVVFRFVVFVKTVPRPLKTKNRVLRNA